MHDITASFGKFLVDKKGQIVKYYAPSIYPLDIEEDIKSLLKWIKKEWVSN